MPILAFIQACQPSGQDDLGSESRFDITGQDSTVAYLRSDNFSNGEQWALTKVRFLRIRISIRSCCARGFAVEVGGVVIATTIDNLCGKPGEQRLRPFRAINHVELPFGLRADDA